MRFIDPEEEYLRKARGGPSKKQMEDDLRRAVLNTGGKVVKGQRQPSEQIEPVRPAGELRMVSGPKPAAAASPAPMSARRAVTAAVRYVEPVAYRGRLRPIASAPPKLRMADPTVLRIEPDYQRDLSPKSQRLIEKIITGWDWLNFKPPICAQTPEGLFVIDGQHTSIAAASHPDIREIPILVVQADQIERRAGAFVAHNRDRIALTAAQIFNGEVTARTGDAREIAAAVHRAGGSVPRYPVSRANASAGQVTAVELLRNIYRANGAAVLERVVRIAVLSKIAPIGRAVLIGIRDVVTAAEFSALPDSKIAGAIAAGGNFAVAAEVRAVGSGKGRGWGAAQLLAERLRAPR